MINNNISKHMTNKDLIFINDLKINAIIGTAKWEQQLERSVIINILITTDFSILINTDTTKTTLFHFNYETIANLITHFCLNKAFDSLVNLAISLEKLLLSAYYESIFNLVIEIKEAFPANNIREAGIHIARSYLKN